jgi:P27 family predicted phage terminase small subunit
MRGRKPKPTALKLLHGVPGHRPLNPHEPLARALGPAPPPELVDDPTALAEWARILKACAAGHVLTTDRAVVVAYCKQWSLWVRLEQEAARYPFILKGAHGTPMQNPLMRLANKACLAMLRASAECGFSPSSRSRISAVPPPLGDGGFTGTDSFSAFQAKRSRF